MGNFISPAENKYPETWYPGYAVKLILDPNLVKFEIIPYEQGTEKTGLRILNIKERIEFNNKIVEMNKILANRNLVSNKYEKYWKTQSL